MGEEQQGIFMRNNETKRPAKRISEIENKEENFGKSEMNLLNLIVEIIVEIILEEEERHHNL